ncbi:uncharacterized protein LOC117607866 isoform X1 [Osmia lignaria lignaria]|uniref:uncharacterized protein LOC117607866 isoform X1 n=3 Tax=Osmia lignaria lignaria TaxID=1437193 RepID=UPI00402B4D27
MQWRRQRRVTHVIGSSNHVLLLARYQDAPPGEEDEEEGLRNGFAKGQENDTSMHSYSRNGQGGYKPRRSGNGDAGTRSHKDESSGSPSQPKIIFNEDEYTRITTPRQDMLFKKGYLSKKKPWAGNANTSATSSTTESQSASHSTAGRGIDGSETTEDQQLLDRDCGTGEYPPMIEPGAQLGYGTFYDHASGYYYEYPVMLVGPAPVPAQVAPSVLAAVPCGPVPLRPIEWINPTFVPKLAGQPYYMMDYETNQCVETAVVSEEQENIVLPVETSNGTCNESCTGSTSCNGSVAGEVEEQGTEGNPVEDEQQGDEQNEEQVEEQYLNEQHVEEQQLENGMNGVPYMEPVLMQQPVHVSHVIPAVPQPYMYPGHYMFGPPLVNVNGVTIQGGPMIRTTDVATMSAACAKRRKKKKRRKQRRLATGNTEGNTDEEEGEYSSECDTGLPSSRLSWTACSSINSNRPLNPECQEFKLRQVVEPDTSLSTIPTSANAPASEECSANQSGTLSSDATNAGNESDQVCNGVVRDESNNRKDDKLIANNSDDVGSSSSSSFSLEKSQSTSPDATNSSDEANRLTNSLFEQEETNRSTNKVVLEDTLEVEKLPNANDNEAANDASLETTIKEMNGVEERSLVNGKMDSDSNNEDATIATPKPSSPCNDERTRSRSITPKTAPLENGGIREENHSSLSSSKPSSNSLPKRKYNAKGAKFVREPTPGPDLDGTAEPEIETKVLTNDLNDLNENLEKANLSNDSKPDSMFEHRSNKTEGDQVSSKFASENVCNHLSKDDPIEASNEDSGFESQTRLSDYPITDAVTEWLRRANSPDIFITSNVSVDSETEDEDDVDEEPPKNLQGNPMPALSANSGVADNASLSRAASSEFARISNVKVQEQLDAANGGGSRKKREAKKRSGERRRVRHTDGTRLDHEVVSSSDSCGQMEDPVNSRRKNPSRQLETVGDVCELTEKDSVAGMRVASNSRMDSKRVNVRRTKRQGRSGRDPTSIIDTKIRRTKDADEKNDVDYDDDDDEGIVEDTMNVRTFEKGEIVVSEEGKLLTTSAHEPVLRNNNDASTTIKAIGTSETAKDTVKRKTVDRKRRSSGEEENCSGRNSLDSIEEPDVLECWEAETIEPVITPKRMLQCEGVMCEGEAAEDDIIEVEQVNIDYVQKYYRLARESATSVEDDTNGSKMNVDFSASSKSVPNQSEQIDDIPTRNGDLVGDKNVPIDEAFEVYESCYTGKPPFLPIDSKVFKSRTFYGQEGEHPIPCRAVCCNIQ